MTNRTTAQDMEAESVDKNDATLIKSPDNNEEIATEVPGNDDTQNISSDINQTLDNPSTDLPEEVVQEIVEVVPEEPEPVEEEPDYSIIAPGSLSRALKKCREEADISIEDAAQEMRLPLSVVKALESESFADLPDPPYVRGYLRSYARLNESDSTNLINHYETLRGADPKDIASFTPVTPRYQPNSKKAVSPTTIKLAGFSMIVMLLVVLSMIPAVSQWASDTWQSFSEPQNQKLAAAAAARQKAEAEANNTAQDNSTQEAAGTGNTDNAASNSDTATADNSEQLALNQPAGDSATEDQNTDTATDNTETAAQDETPEQATDATESDTPAEDATKAAEATDTDTTESTSESAAADKTQDAVADPNTEQTDTTASDTDTPATDTDADTAQAVAAAEAEAAAAAKQQQEQAAAEKAAAEKAEADKLAAQQAEAAKKEDKFQQPIDGSVLIRLVFTQDVWMSIKDGRGKTIFGALNAAGTRKELKASTPLQFKVGNAPGVQIYLNGQLIDQKPYTRGSVSTFRAN